MIEQISHSGSMWQELTRANGLSWQWVSSPGYAHGRLRERPHCPDSDML